MMPIPSPVLTAARRVAVSTGAAGLILTGMIVFGTRPPPPPMRAITDVAVAQARSQPLPPLRRYAARDGAALAYRLFEPAAAPSRPPLVAVLVHGSGGSSANMNVLGHALAARGVPAVAMDIRGHGSSGRRGDIDHIGQLEDDLADLTAGVKARYPGARLVLVGHSSGGGFVLRAAGEPVGKAFDRFVLLAPYLGHDQPTTRPASGGWVAVYMPRIIALSILNRFGITAFNGLPVLAFALPAGIPAGKATPFWSYRLMENFGPHETGLTFGRPAYLVDADRAAGPIAILAGRQDESFYADRYPAAFSPSKHPVAVTLISGVGHMGLIGDPRALPQVTGAIVGHTFTPG
jgi:alpha-beta hydrolase superfamily lysophospholipase